MPIDPKQQRQSTNVETPAPGTDSVPPESYAKMAQSMRDNADAGAQLGSDAMDALGAQAKKNDWLKRSRLPFERHQNKGYTAKE